MIVGGINIDKYVQSPTVTHRFRARSVVYALDGTANEDRLGDAKKMLTLPFALVPATDWETVRTALSAKEISVSGGIGGIGVSGKYRLAGNDIPTPILNVYNGIYVTQPFSVTLEEI